MTLISVLFVCSGNICRSPMAEGVLRHYAPGIRVASCGTHGLHQGEPPDDRAISLALEKGLDIRSQRARKITPSDLSEFALVLGLDSGHVRQLKDMDRSGEHAGKIHLFLDYAGHSGARDVPDPYYGGADDFEHAYGLIEEGVRGLLARHEN